MRVLRVKSACDPVQSKCASSVQHGSAAPGARRLRCPQRSGAWPHCAHGTWSYRYAVGLPNGSSNFPARAGPQHAHTLSFYLHTYNVNAPSGGQARQGPQIHSIHSRTPSVHSDTRPDRINGSVRKYTRYKCTTAIDRQQTMHRPLSHVTHHVYAANWRALLTYLPHAVTRH